MMRELTLKELQQVSISILKDVHDFCNNNNIHYSLAYGSLIGAKRHKGFIPWDDDIDIVMIRPEYERFCNLYNSDKNILIKPNESYLCFARVCDNSLTISRSLSPWCVRPVGVWIDIFPLDGVEDDRNLFSQRILRLKGLLDQQVLVRSAMVNFSLSKTWKQNVRLLIRKFICSFKSVNRINDKVSKIVSEIPYGATLHCSQLVCRGNQDKEFFDIELFKDYENTVFEQYEFMVASGWEKILQLNYGDYTQLPPPQERVPHSGYVKFYWKNKGDI